MYETERQKAKRMALDMSRKRQNAKLKEMNEMYDIYESFIDDGCTQGSAITKTSATTGIARATVAGRIYKRYGNTTKQECSLEQVG